MGLDLNTKVYNAYGYNVVDSDFAGSRKWNYAIYDKTDLTKQQTKNIFNYYQNHDFFNAARGAAGFLGRGKPLNEQKELFNKLNPFGATSSPLSGGLSFDTRGVDVGRKPVKYDYFADLRKGGNFFKDKINVTYGDDGKVTYYDQAYKTQYKSNSPFGRNVWSDQAPSQNVASPFGGKQQRNLSPNRNLHVSTRQQGTGQIKGDQQTGYMLNGAFVPENIYTQMTDREKQFYGKTLNEALELDPALSAANQVVDAARQYRKARSRKKTGIGAYLPTAITAGLTLTGNPYLAAIGGGVGSAQQGGGLTDILTGGLKGFAGANGFNEFSGGFNTPGFNPNSLQGSGNVSIFDSIGNLFNDFDFGGFDLGGLTSVFNPSSSGGGIFSNSNGSNNPLDFFSGSGGGIFDNINNVLNSPIGQLGTDLLSGYLFNNEADEYTNRLRNAAEGAEYNPYNAQGPGGGVTYNNGQATTYLSPAMQALTNLLYGSASGNINAFNSYDPSQQAAEQFNILENIAQPYRDKERDSLMSTLINQGVYNPNGGVGSPGYWQPRYLEDSINASRDKNLFDSYNLAQQTATNTLNRGIGSTNLLNSLNYGPLQYAGLGADLGRAQSSAYATGIPYIQQAAEYDRNADSTIFNSLLNSLGRRV